LAESGAFTGLNYFVQHPSTVVARGPLFEFYGSPVSIGRPDDYFRRRASGHDRSAALHRLQLHR
jgi:hypothetical protein